MGVRHLIWIFPAVVTLHNAEEAIWLPAWSARAGRWYKPIAPWVFRFAAMVLTVVVWLITWMSVRSGKQSVWAYLTFGYMAAMLGNTFIPHVALTVATRKYMLGLASALALNLPLLSWLIWLALKEGRVSGGKAIASILCVPMLLALSIPLLFKIGKAMAL
jgi:hypothetical protein